MPEPFARLWTESSHSRQPGKPWATSSQDAQKARSSPRCSDPTGAQHDCVAARVTYLDMLMNQNCTDRPMDGATGNPFRRPLTYWPVRATVRSVDSTLYSFLRLSTLSTSPESVKTPQRNRKTLRMRKSSRSYGGSRI